MLRKPNIILVMADDMGWGDTGYGGSSFAQTPNLDEMAAAGTTFSRFYSAAPVCSPTRGSVLTGRHPYRYGIYFANVGHLPSEEVTLAEVLKGAGYRTGFFGKWHLGTLTRDILDSNRGGRPDQIENYSPPWLHGFDTVFATESKAPTYDPMIKPKDIDRETWWDVVNESDNAEPFGTRYWNEQGNTVLENLAGDDSKIIVDRLIPFVEKAVADDVPFLAVVWTHAPHLPVVAANEDKQMIDSADPYTRHYFGSIHALDTQIGRIRAMLVQAGVSNNTMLWFTSDNGPEHQYDNAPGSSGGLRGAKRSLYEGGIRVPGIIEWPNQIAAAQVTDVAAVTSDIYPTILDYLEIGETVGNEIDGVSMRPVLSGAKKYRDSGIGFESNSQIAYVDDHFKLIHQPAIASANPSLQGQSSDATESLGPNTEKTLRFELYDLGQDPHETTDLSAENVDKLAELTEKLNLWRHSVAASIEHYKNVDEQANAGAQ
jgi:arylsulfatase A-like enzyme